MAEIKYYKNDLALVETEYIGENTRIWAFAHIMKDVHIGKRCNIGENCFVESGVRIGNDVVIKNNIAIWEGVTIEDGVFLGPNIVLTNELEPRSMYPKEIARTLIKKGATIGANATIIANTVIGSYATIGAGSVITKDVPDHSLVYGNPGRIKGWVCICGRKLKFNENHADCICNNKYILENNLIIKL